MRFAAVVLACASTVLGYTVTSPNQSQGWTNQGAQRLTWTRVATDRENFTVVLTNPSTALMPAPQVLAALVDGSLGNTTLNPPSAGWPSPGTGYVLNIVAEATNLNSILAQSPPFEIELSTVVPSSTRTTASGSTQTTLPNGAQATDDTVPNKNGAMSIAAPAALAALAGLVPALFA
ncbi:hypothetical protein MD484_g4015, partial [Candolleomyces efflorescens]